VQPISIIVLAGGESRRMGTNKALLKVGESETLIGRVIRNMRAVSDDIIVVSNTPDLYEDLGTRQAGDRFPGAGPLAGLHAGLQVAHNEWSFAVACDMPLVDHRLVRYMILLSHGHDAVVPRLDDEMEPLHALYSKACLAAIEARLQAGQRRVISFFPDVRVRLVESREVAIFDPDGQSFFNANTPEDWQRLQKLLKSKDRRRGSKD
jgi:molybdopterin-guanine dinucleotide biosynthesis protein A